LGIDLITFKPNSVQAEQPNFKKKVNVELLHLYLKMLKRLPYSQSVMVLSIGLFVGQSVPIFLIVGWGLALILLECVRSSYAYKIEPNYDQANLRRVMLRLVVLSLLAGFLHGLSLLLFIPYLPEVDQSLLYIVQFLNVTGSFTIPTFIVYGCYPLTILVITVLSRLYSHSEQLSEITMVMSLFLAFLFLLHRNNQMFIKWSIATHLDRNRILEDLDLKNIEILNTIEKAEQASQARARVLAAASHDLRQPLQALSVYSAVLQSSPDPKTLPYVAENIDRLVRVLGSLLHGLLDLSRLSNEYYVPERQRISLDRLAADICSEFTQQAEDKHLKLIQQLDYVRLLDDKVGISRILRNLLDNAIKYTDHGEVRISTYQQGDKAYLTVTDTGKGIPDEEKLRIYEEFYQLNNPGRDLSRGIGLGLTIVQRLCELIGIQIQLESELGQGSSFKLIFNSVLKEPISKPLSKPFQPADLVGKRIYIVDDEQDILNSMRTLLHTWKMIVETANSGAGIKHLIKTQGIPDLMIIDLRLGDEQGAHLAKQLQNTYGNFPVLVMTGETASAQLKESSALGFTVLFKPIPTEMIIETFQFIFKH
jgi:two-component system, sensor histidine kinase